MWDRRRETVMSQDVEEAAVETEVDEALETMEEEAETEGKSKLKEKAYLKEL
jgi:hypothetical protein